MGHVPRHAVRLVVLHRHDGPVPLPAVPLHSRAAHDLHLRDAHTSPRAGGEGSAMKASHLYGVMAEFDNPTDLIDAVRRARQQGYRRMDAYSPMPIEGLDEEIGHHRTYLPFLVLVGG